MFCTTPEQKLKHNGNLFQSFKQDSPPAWTQEAYRPQHIKYSICYPRWGTPPPARSDGGGGTWGGETPQQGYPPARSKVGYPPGPHPSDAVGNNTYFISLSTTSDAMEPVAEILISMRGGGGWPENTTLCSRIMSSLRTLFYKSK